MAATPGAVRRPKRMPPSAVELRARACYRAVERILESDLPTPAQQWSVLRILSADELAAAAEERALAGRCGNPGCGNAPGDLRPVAGVRAGSGGGADGITCSRACLLAIKDLGEKLGDSGAAQARFDALVEKVKLRRQRERAAATGGEAAGAGGEGRAAGRGAANGAGAALAAGTPSAPILKERVVEHAPKGPGEASGGAAALPAPGSKEALEAARTVEGYVRAHRKASKKGGRTDVDAETAVETPAQQAARPQASARAAPATAAAATLVAPALPAAPAASLARKGSGVRFADEVPGGTLDDGGVKGVGGAPAAASAGHASAEGAREAPAAASAGHASAEGPREAPAAASAGHASAEGPREAPAAASAGLASSEDAASADAAAEALRGLSVREKDGEEAMGETGRSEGKREVDRTADPPSSPASRAPAPLSSAPPPSAPAPTSLSSLLGPCTPEEALAATSAAAPPPAAELTAAQTEALLRAAAARRGLSVLNPRMEAALPRDIDEQIEAQLRAAGLADAARGGGRDRGRGRSGGAPGAGGAPARGPGAASPPSSSDDEEAEALPASERWRDESDEEEEEENDDPWYSTDEESDGEGVLEEGGAAAAPGSAAPPDPLDASAAGAGHAPPGGSRFRVKMTLFGSSFTFFENWCTAETRALVAGAEGDVAGDEDAEDAEGEEGRAAAGAGGAAEPGGAVQKRIRDAKRAEGTKRGDENTRAEKGGPTAAGDGDSEGGNAAAGSADDSEGGNAAAEGPAFSAPPLPSAPSYVDPPALAPLREAASAALLSGLADARQAGALSRAPLGALRAAMLDFCGTLRARTQLPPLRARQWRLPALVALKAMSLDAAPRLRADFEDRDGLRATYKALEEIGVTDEEFDALLDLVVHGEEW